MPLRVLVVARDFARRSRLAEGITSHGFDVLAMATVDRTAALHYDPTAAVVDLVAHPAAGLAAAQALRFIPAGRAPVRPLPGLPIIALTADETWRNRLSSGIPAVTLATDTTMPGELWALRHRG